MSEPDWEHLSTFVAVARTGSLTAGARQRGISQPTAGRHVQALEEALSVTLFVRHPRGLTLTDEGSALFEDAAAIAGRIQALFRGAHPAASQVAGSVRISAAEPIGGHAITPVLRSLRQTHPDLRFEIVIDNSPANLWKREADIAVRMFRPTQLDLHAKRVGEIELGMFATDEYLARHGVPDGIGAARQHTLIGNDRDAFWHRAIAELGLSPRDFAYRSDSLLAQIQAIRDSVGIGVMHVPLAARDPHLIRVLPELALPPLEMWLLMHRDLRGNLAARTVYAALGEALRAYLTKPSTA